MESRTHSGSEALSTQMVLPCADVYLLLHCWRQGTEAFPDSSCSWPKKVHALEILPGHGSRALGVYTFWKTISVVSKKFRLLFGPTLEANGRGSPCVCFSALASHQSKSGSIMTCSCGLCEQHVSGKQKIQAFGQPTRDVM